MVQQADDAHLQLQQLDDYEERDWQRRLGSKPLRLYKGP
jgi:hypothetical protein